MCEASLSFDMTCFFGSVILNSQRLASFAPALRQFQVILPAMLWWLAKRLLLHELACISFSCSLLVRFIEP